MKINFNAIVPLKDDYVKFDFYVNAQLKPIKLC